MISFYHHRQIPLLLVELGHKWRASRHCGPELSPWPRSMIFLSFLSHPLFVLRHVLFGLPLLLYPWGFQFNAVFSIAPVFLRNVCPIQFHFLFIWFSIDFWLVILHSSSFVILPVHFIFIIRLKHLFTNICSLLVIWLVVFQVSQTYNNTDSFVIILPYLCTGQSTDKWSAFRHVRKIATNDC